MAQSDRPDQKLVQKAVRGDQKAFRELFERYFQALYNYALTLSHDPALAEDITQEAFIRAHANLHRLGPPWNFQAWLFRLARNHFIDLIRKQRDLLELKDERQVISHDPSPERETISSEAAEKVHRMLGRLPDHQREILTLRELQGFSYAEIGEIMELSSSNVKVTLHRARAAFQESYGIQLLLEDPSGDCLEVSQLLETLHDGENLQDRERFVKEHLKVCEACQERRDALIRQSAILGAFIPIAPPKGLASRILEQIGAQPPPTPGPKGGNIKQLLGYGGLAGLVGAMIFLMINIVVNPEKILPNFPGTNGPVPTQSEGIVSPPGVSGQSSPTPEALNSESGPVPPAARCGQFEDLEVAAVFLNVREDKMTLPLYFRIQGGVPGLSEGGSADEEAWYYAGRLGEFISSSCNLQGFDDRLYCIFTIPEGMPGTYQELALYLGGCEAPVAYFPRVSVPELVVPEPEKETPVCEASLGKAACEAAGGMYFIFSRTAYCACP